MSAYHVCEVEFKDEQTLVEALKEMGFQPEVHKEAQPLKSRYLSANRDDVKGHIVVRQGQHQGAGDIGFERQSNGQYKMHYDHMDVGENHRFSLKKLKRCYAETSVKRVVKSSTRYSMVSRQEEDGKIRIRLRRR